MSTENSERPMTPTEYFKRQNDGQTPQEMFEAGITLNPNFCTDLMRGYSKYLLEQKANDK